MRSKRPLTLFLGGIGVVAFGVGIAALCKYYDFPFVATHAESASQAYRQAGLPWELSDIAQSPPVKDKDNAALVIEPLVTWFRTHRKNEAAIIGLLDAKDFKGALAILAPHSPKLAKAKEASKLPRMDFNHDWDDEFTTLTEVRTMIDMVRLLSLRAQARVGLKRNEEAFDDLKTAWDLAHLIAADPNSTSAEGKASAMVYTLRCMERCAAAWSADRPNLVRLGDLLSKPMPKTDWKAVFTVDMYCSLASLRNAEFNLNGEWTWESKPRSRTIRRTGLPEDTKARAYIAKFCDISIQVARIIEDNQNDLRAMALRMEKLSGKFEEGKSLSNQMNSRYFPWVWAAWKNEYELRALQTCLKTLLQALIRKIDTGKLPTRIAEIPGRWPDPFTEESLQVKTTGNSIRVYSLGVNRTDNDGRRGFEAKMSEMRSDLDDMMMAYPPVHQKSKYPEFNYSR